MKKRLLGMILCGVMAMSVLAGCSKPSTPSTGDGKAPESKPAEKQIVLRLAEIHPEDYPTTLGDKEFARLVEERSKGRIKIQVYAGAQLGQEKAVIEQVQFGAIDFARISVSPVSEFAKELNVLQLPYIYRDADHMWKVLEGPIGDDLLKAVDKAKLVGLSWYDAGARNFYNSKKEIKSVSDLKGLKIRVQQSKLMMDMITALGASPTPMDMGEVYSGLQTGVIDGAENNWPSYTSASHNEVAKFYTVDGHTRVPEITVASKSTLDKLSKEDQELIRKAAKDAVKVQKEAWAKTEKESEEKAKASGSKITVLDAAAIAEFQKAVAPLYAETAKDHSALIKRIQDTK
jgi:tripartite ATP-independent transporter DctP family solute receptor